LSRNEPTQSPSQYSSSLLMELATRARRVRKALLRAVCEAGSGHCGGALSIVEILCALYFHELRVDPARPCWEQRDRFVLSKGHACAALYAVLAEASFLSDEWTHKLRRIDGSFPGHPDMKGTPGVDMTTGSLGQGISAAVGMALGARLLANGARVYCVIGDGESQSGEVWEAAMSAAHYRLDNLVTFLDYNGLQIDGPVVEVLNIEPVTDKWRAFGWHVLDIDGHDFVQILGALDEARITQRRPTIIVAHTVKGRGVSFMEDAVDYHGKAPGKGELELALKEVEGQP